MDLRLKTTDYAMTPEVRAYLDEKIAAIEKLLAHQIDIARLEVELGKAEGHAHQGDIWRAEFILVRGGDRIVAVSLVPPGLDAEDYQPKPQDALRLKQARLLVRVGLDYDLWADRLLAQVGRPEISRGGAAYVDTSLAIAVLELRGMSVGPGDGHAHGSGNPHYWLDQKNAETITANILEALARIDPAKDR